MLLWARNEKRASQENAGAQIVQFQLHYSNALEIARPGCNIYGVAGMWRIDALCITCRGIEPD